MELAKDKKEERRKENRWSHHLLSWWPDLVTRCSTNEKKTNAHNPAPVDNFFSRHSHAADFSSLSKSCVSSREKWLSSVIIPVECFASAGFAGEEKHNSFRNLDNAISKSSWRREPDVYTEVVYRSNHLRTLKKHVKSRGFQSSIFNRAEFTATSAGRCGAVSFDWRRKISKRKDERNIYIYGKRE